MLSLVHLKELLRLYNADLFEAHDRLRLRLLNPKLLRDFRAACARHGTTPGDSLENFLWVLSLQE